MIEEMLLNPHMYGNKFDKIFYFTPHKLPTVPSTEGDNWFKELDPAFIKKTMEEYGKANPTHNVCIVFDD